MTRKRKKKESPQNLLREQAEFAIRITDPDVSIQEIDFIQCPGTETYAKAATTTTTTTTTTNNSTLTEPKTKRTRTLVTLRV